MDYPPRKCALPTCKTVFTPTRAKHVYCSTYCNHAAFVNKRRAGYTPRSARTCSECGVILPAAKRVICGKPECANSRKLKLRPNYVARTTAKPKPAKTRVTGYFEANGRVRVKERYCLKCHKLFKSEWTGNRKCPRCTRRMLEVGRKSRAAELAWVLEDE